jgi:hypothetical protein
MAWICLLCEWITIATRFQTLTCSNQFSCVVMIVLALLETQCMAAHDGRTIFFLSCGSMSSILQVLTIFIWFSEKCS